MTLFLTSSPTMGDGYLNPANDFVEELRRNLPSPLNCVMITSCPDDKQTTDKMAWEMRESFERADLPFDHYEVLDRRTQKYAARMLRNANFLIFCGGHVPTQNKFFKDLKLAQRIDKYDGVIMTISAGSMNCADVVYASPELNGEAVNPGYMRYITGLSITPINVMPHYQNVRGLILDGIPINEILRQDSYARPIYLIPDGSYFKINHMHAILHGEAYLLRYGVKSLLCKKNETKIIY